MANKNKTSPISNLKDKYLSKVLPSMIDHFGYKNKMEVPNLTHISNVMLVHGGRPTRIGYKKLDDGSKVRIAINTGDEIRT